MNFNQIINMVVRAVMRRAIRSGVNAGIDVATKAARNRKGKGDEPEIDDYGIHREARRVAGQPGEASQPPVPPAPSEQVMPAAQAGEGGQDKATRRAARYRWLLATY